MRMDRESPLVTELSPDDPSFPLLSQRSSAVSRGSKAAPAAAAFAPQHPSSSVGRAASDAAAARKLPQQQQKAHSNSQQPQSSSEGRHTGKQQARPGSQQKLESFEPYDPSGKQQSGIHLPSAPAAASHAASASTGELPEFLQVAATLHSSFTRGRWSPQSLSRDSISFCTVVTHLWPCIGMCQGQTAPIVFAGCSCPYIVVHV